MLTNAKHLKGLEIRATDGEIGTVNQFYFDHESWAIRYLAKPGRSATSRRQSGIGDRARRCWFHLRGLSE
jgi:hypothetical protein